MTITQLEYIVALDNYGSFLTASEKSFVTQPTLSMQVRKLEEELGIILFDRTKHPIIPTELGRVIIDQARVVINEANKIKEIIAEQQNEIQGRLKVGIIPTLAPYLLPLFISKFFKKYPKVSLTVEEIVTDRIIELLQNNELDCGILVTPLPVSGMITTPLFYEPFVAYTGKATSIAKKTTITLDDISLSEMWLLNEGHCFKNQVENLCFGSKKSSSETNFEYQSGSVETLIKLVENNGGYTILPELSIKGFSARQTSMVRYFKNPEPTREVSVLTPKNVIKKRLIVALQQEIRNCVPEKMISKGHKNVVKI